MIKNKNFYTLYEIYTSLFKCYKKDKKAETPIRNNKIWLALKNLHHQLKYQKFNPHNLLCYKILKLKNWINSSTKLLWSENELTQEPSYTGQTLAAS